MFFFKKLFYGNYLMIIHYLRTLKNLYSFMPKIKEISYRSKNDENFEIKFNKDSINKINIGFQEINKKILDIEKDAWDVLRYDYKMTMFFIIRLIMIYTTYYKQYSYLILLSLTQFILLPYSFFSSISMTFDF